MSGTDQIRTVPIEYMTFRMLISEKNTKIITQIKIRFGYIQLNELRIQLFQKTA